MTLPRFVYKAHATGNDFAIYIDEQGVFNPTAQEVRGLCDRHFGLGGDGLIRLTHPNAVCDLDDSQIRDCVDNHAVWFMDYRNADGSLAQMCGNGTRAVTLLAQRKGLAPQVGQGVFTLGTRSGVKTLRSLGEVAPYGRDVFEVSLGRCRCVKQDAYAVALLGSQGSWNGTFVDMGNPHVVVVDSSLPANGGSNSTGGNAESAALASVTAGMPCSIDSLDLSKRPVVTPVIEAGQNVEFVHIDGIDRSECRGEATMRVYERGCGETLSCGTGLGASAVTLEAKTGIADWDVHVRGGLLHVAVSQDDVKLTGAAKVVGRVELL